MWSAYRRLPRITCPCMVVHGDQDRLVPPENGRIIASRIPGAQFHLIRNAGHILITDQQQKAMRIVGDFLSAQK